MPNTRFTGSNPQLDADQGEYGDPDGNTPYASPHDPIMLADLPTEDPEVEGAVWNDAGTPVVSEGPVGPE